MAMINNRIGIQQEQVSQSVELAKADATTKTKNTGNAGTVEKTHRDYPTFRDLQNDRGNLQPGDTVTYGVMIDGKSYVVYGHVDDKGDLYIDKKEPQKPPRQ